MPLTASFFEKKLGKKLPENGYILKVAFILSKPTRTWTLNLENCISHRRSRRSKGCVSLLWLSFNLKFKACVRARLEKLNFTLNDTHVMKVFEGAETFFKKFLQKNFSLIHILLCGDEEDLSPHS